MKIKELNVKVTYYVGLRDVEVSDDLYKALQHMAECGEVSCGLATMDKRIDTAMEWLGDNIQEDDACNWEYEITDMEDYENEQGNTND